MEVVRQRQLEIWIDPILAVDFPDAVGRRDDLLFNQATFFCEVQYAFLHTRESSLSNRLPIGSPSLQKPLQEFEMLWGKRWQKIRQKGFTVFVARVLLLCVLHGYNES